MMLVLYGKTNRGGCFTHPQTMERREVILVMNRQNIERWLSVCPEADGSDFLTYPPASEEEFLAMEQEFYVNSSYVCFFPFVRQNHAGDGYIDLYVWDTMLYPESYCRFIICEGFCLPSEQENRFLEYSRGSSVHIDEGRMERMNQGIARLFPNWHYPSYNADEFGKALEHAYFASHRSGAKEILYKADLNNIAYHLNRLPVYNLIGTTPEAIIGHDLPLKLLRILNQQPLLHNLFSEETIENCRKLYKKYSGYIGKELPSCGQWSYLDALCKNDGMFGGHSFIRALYNRLSFPMCEDTLGVYERFLILRDEVPDIGKIKIPKTYEVWDAVELLNAVKRCMSDSGQVDVLIEKRKSRADYEYSGEKFTVTMPRNSMEICREAIAQGNCAMEYINDHAHGKTTILFVRKKDHPDKPLVTMEVRDWVIRQVYGRSNSIPKKEIYDFLREYAGKCWLFYDPHKLLEEALEQNDDIEVYQLDDDLFDFWWEYRSKQHEAEDLPPTSVCYKQMTIEEWCSVLAK